MVFPVDETQHPTEYLSHKTFKKNETTKNKGLLQAQ